RWPLPRRTRAAPAQRTASVRPRRSAGAVRRPHLPTLLLRAPGATTDRVPPASPPCRTAAAIPLPAPVATAQRDPATPRQLAAPIRRSGPASLRRTAAATGHWDPAATPRLPAAPTRHSDPASLRLQAAAEAGRWDPAATLRAATTGRWDPAASPRAAAAAPCDPAARPPAAAATGRWDPAASPRAAGASPHSGPAPRLRRSQATRCRAPRHPRPDPLRPLPGTDRGRRAVAQRGSPPQASDPPDGAFPRGAAIPA